MFANGGFLALLLVFPSTLLCGADDDQFLERIDDFRREAVAPLNEAFGSERFGKLVNETAKTMEFFGWLGNLMVKGTVGHCNYTKDYHEQNCKVVFSDDVTGALKQNILVLFEEMNAFHPSIGSENFERILSDKAKVDLDARKMMEEPGALSDLLKLSTRFYSLWNSWATSFVNKTSKEVLILQREVSALCYRDWKVRNPADATTNVILALTYLMGPHCDRVDDETGEYRYMGAEIYRDEYFKVAQKKGFSGGDSNRCLQKFLIRFADYDKRIYELFVDYLGRYIFQTITFYGYCLPIAFPEQEERESWVEWAAESLGVLQTQLVEARDVFDETPSDRPLIEAIDSFRHNQFARINASFGFERLRNIVDRSRDVMEFYGWLGSLFTTGILGHFGEGIWQEKIYVGTDGSETLQQFVFALFEDMFTFNVHRIYGLEPYPSPAKLNDPFVRVFYRKGDDEKETALDLARGFGALLYLLEPGCEVARDGRRIDSGRDYILEKFQLMYSRIANESGLTGGGSNRCFQKFVVRYTGYNRTTYETLVDYLAEYLFQEVTVYGYCLAITRTDSKERDNWIEWAENGLKAILKQMSDALEVFDEPRPPPGTSVPPTVWTSSLPRKSRITMADLKHVVDIVLPSKGIEGSMDWAKRAGKHKAIADEIYEKFDAAYDSGYGVSFQVLVSLLQDKDPSDMQCMQSESKRHMNSSNSGGVSYFVQYFDKIALSVGFNSTWKGIQNKKADIVDAVFSSETQNLCKATKEEIEKAVNKKVFGLKDGFSGLAVVRCGREFVWYELGYRYFTVGRTAGPSFTLVSSNDGTYNANCGQIFLFP